MCNFFSGYVIKRGLLYSMTTDSHSDVVMEHKESMQLTDDEIENGVPVELTLVAGGDYNNHDDFKFVIDCNHVPAWFDDSVKASTEKEMREILKRILPPLDELEVFSRNLDLEGYAHDFNAPKLTTTGYLYLRGYAKESELRQMIKDNKNKGASK